MDIATTIRQGRAAKGLSQRELAKLLKVSGGAVGQWENGTNSVSIENRVTLSKVLGIPFVDLLPELDLKQELLVRDPQALVLLQHYLRLPAPVREALLMQVVAVAESLGLNRTQ
jgi:transcriptional regulator with XRE-family HTH domain